MQVSDKASRFLLKKRGHTGWKEKLLYYGAIPKEVEYEHYYSFKITRVFYFISTATLFDSFITACIVLNTFVLALDRFPEMPEGEQNTLNAFNLFFTAVFTIEVVVKFIGLRYNVYLSDKFNILDLVTVVLSLVELCLPKGDE